MASTTRLSEYFSGGSWDSNLAALEWNSVNTVTLTTSSGLGRVSWASGSQTNRTGTIALTNVTSMVDTEVVSLVNNMTSSTVGAGHVHRMTSGSSPNGYLVMSDPVIQNKFYIYRADSGVNTLLSTTTISGITLPYYLKSQCTGGRVQFKVWNATSLEPDWTDATKTGSATDYTYSSGGRCGLAHTGIAVTGDYVEWDEVLVREFTSMPTVDVSILIS